MSKQSPLYVSSNQRVPEYLQKSGSCISKPKLPLFAQLHTSTEAKVPIQNLSLPGCWTLATKTQSVELDPGNLTATFQGPGKTESDSVVVRGNVPISKACGIYYYEISIVSKGRDGYIGVGFTTLQTPSNKLPGLEDGSWGYHAADGKKFGGSGQTSSSYGPTYTTGDIIGCCINFAEKNIAFTRNGIMLGLAFKNVAAIDDATQIYPCVGLRTPGEKIRVNFGREPFKFDMTQFYKDEKARLWRSINQTSLSIKTPRPIPECSIMNVLVVEWLVRAGYSETAKELYNNSLGQSHVLDDTNLTFESLKGVHGLNDHLQSLIMQGLIDDAIEFIQKVNPTLFMMNPSAHCQLLCLKFIEILKCNSEKMDIDGLLHEAVMFLKSIKNTFKNSLPQIQEAIAELTKLFCYNDPESSPFHYVFQDHVRVEIAESLNNAFLETLGIDSVSPLEKLLKQANLVNAQLHEQKSGTAVLMDYDNHVLGIEN